MIKAADYMPTSSCREKHIGKCPTREHTLCVIITIMAIPQ